MTFPVMPLRHVFCIMALMLSCSSVAVFADEGTRDPQPAITPPTTSAFSGVGGLPDVNSVTHDSAVVYGFGAPPAVPPEKVRVPVPPGAAGSSAGAKVTGPHPEGLPRTAPAGSHPGGAKSVAGVPGIDVPPYDNLVTAVSSSTHPGPGFPYNTCGSASPERGDGKNKYCVPELPGSAPPHVGEPGQPLPSGAAPAIPGYQGAHDFQSGALSSTLNDGKDGLPRVGVNSFHESKTGQHPPNTPVAPHSTAVDPRGPAAIPGFPNGYPGVGVTGPVHPTTPLGSHPGAGPIVSQHNDQVPGAASGPSGGKGNQAGSTVAASPPEVSTPANNQSGGKQDADAVSVGQPSQTPTAPAQSGSTTDTPNSSNTKGSQSTTTGTTTLPPVTANSKKPKGKGDANSSRITSVWVRVPLLIVVALATGLVC